MKLKSKETQEDNVSTNDILEAFHRDIDASLAKARKDGWVPGIVYGKGFEAVHIQVKKTELSKFLRHSGKVFEVSVKGHGKHLVAMDELQRGHLGTDYTHFSFHKVSASEKTTVTLPIHFEGNAHGTKEGGVVNTVMNEVEVRGLPKDLPEFVTVDVSTLDLNGHWTLGDITPPAGCEWAHNTEDNVVSCAMPKLKIVEEPTTEEVAAEATTEAPEGEITPVEETKEAA